MDSDIKRAAGYLGLAARAGQVASGEESALMLIRKGGAALAFLDETTGPNTTKRIEDACAYHGVKLARLPQGALGTAIGKPGRMAAAIRKGSLADSLSAALFDKT